jgi:predicted permease
MGEKLMPANPRWRRYLRLFGPDVGADVSDEMRFHIDARISELMESGVSRAEAEREAVRHFGDVGEVSALCRRIGEDGLRTRSRGRRIEEWWYDTRHAVRSLRRAPWFAVAAVATLATGIGGATCVFSVVEAWVIRAVRFPDPSQLVYARSLDTQRGREVTVSYPDYTDLRARSPQFQSLAAWSLDSFTWTTREGTERLGGVRVTPNFWETLRARPAQGRGFTEEDGTPGRNRVVIVSYGFWRTRLNGDAAALGSKLRLDGDEYTVVGVLEERFHFVLTGVANVWVPIDTAGELAARRQARYLQLLGRMKPGVTVAQARQELSSGAATLAASYPDSNRNVGAFCIPLSEEVGRHTGGQIILVLFGVTLGLLLIACSNVANLLLVRALGRQRHAAIQISLGASKGRLLRQALAETLALFLAAAAMGAAFGAWLTDFSTSFIPMQNRGFLPDYGHASLNWKVLAFTIGISLAAGLAFGLSPALENTRANLVSVLKESGSAVSLGRRAKRLRWVLATAQIVLGTILVSSTVLLVAGFRSAWSSPMGFDSAGVLTFTLSLDARKYASAMSRRVFFESAAEAASAPDQPAIARFVPFGNSMGATPFRVPRQANLDQRRVPTAEFNAVSPEFFAAMRIPLISGRAFDTRDAQNARLVVIINDALATQYLDGGNPVGQELRLGRLQDRAAEIVGVVREIRNGPDVHRGSPQVYVPFAQSPSADAYLIARPRGADPLAALPGIRRRIAALDPGQPVFDAKTLDERLREALAPYQIVSGLLVWFSSLALILAAVGVYGVVAFSVSQRTREIGIRAALGAGRGALLRLLLRQGLWVLCAGLLIGLPCSFAAALGLRSLLADVLPPDITRPVLFTAGVICAAVLIATLVPARKASSIDPVSAIRYE